MVANGTYIPVSSVGTANSYGSFHIPDVLVAPGMVHNLLSIRRFTTDNSCSIEFDPSGLTVRDLASRRPLLRCNWASLHPSFSGFRCTSFAFLFTPFSICLHHHHLHYVAPSPWPSRQLCFDTAQSQFRCALPPPS